MRRIGAEIFRTLVEEPFTATIDPHRAAIGREQPLHRLEAEVLAVLTVGWFAQQVFVAKVRALVIDAHARREPSAAERERQPNHVIGVQQVVRRSAEVELREHAGAECELETVAGMRAVPASETERVAYADGCNVERRVGEVVSRLVLEEARKRVERLGVGNERAENIAARQGDIPLLFTR